MYIFFKKNTVGKLLSSKLWLCSFVTFVQCLEIISSKNINFSLSVGFAVKEILKLCPERVLVTLYNLPSFDSVDDFLQKVATIRGKLKKGGIVDVEAAARIVLHDWNEGMYE